MRRYNTFTLLGKRCALNTGSTLVQTLETLKIESGIVTAEDCLIGASSRPLLSRSVADPSIPAHRDANPIRGKQKQAETEEVLAELQETAETYTPFARLCSSCALIRRRPCQ